MTGRIVPEWVADHADQAIPARVKLRLWERCGGRCAISGRQLKPGEFDFDHIKALALGGEHRESNLQVIAKDVHREKTRADVAAKSKAARTRVKHLGIAKSKRGFRRPPGAKFNWQTGRYEFPQK
jgi:hypothetical protein